MDMKENGKTSKYLCWVCGEDNAFIPVTVETDKPDGSHVKPHNVRVHFRCFKVYRTVKGK